MKYLKKNEAKLNTIQYKDMTDWGSTEPQKVKKQIDPEYFNLVFADFIDEGATVEFDTTEDHIEDYWEIFIDEPMIRSIRNIDEYLKEIDILNEKYLDIKSCINKIKDDYPHIDIHFDIEKEQDEWGEEYQRLIHLIFKYK